MSNYMKMGPVGGELSHADAQTDGRTDMKLIRAFRIFAPTPHRMKHAVY